MTWSGDVTRSALWLSGDGWGLLGLLAPEGAEGGERGHRRRGGMLGQSDHLVGGVLWIQNPCWSRREEEDAET